MAGLWISDEPASHLNDRHSFSSLVIQQSDGSHCMVIFMQHVPRLWEKAEITWSCTRASFSPPTPFSTGSECWRWQQSGSWGSALIIMQLRAVWMPTEKNHTLQNQTHSYWCHFAKDKQIQSTFRAEEQWLMRCQNSFPVSAWFAQTLEQLFFESLH